MRVTNPAVASSTLALARGYEAERGCLGEAPRALEGRLRRKLPRNAGCAVAPLAWRYRQVMR